MNDISQELILQVLQIIQQNCNLDNQYTYATHIIVPTNMGSTNYKLVIKQYNIDKLGNAKTTSIIIKEENN